MPGLIARITIADDPSHVTGAGLSVTHSSQADGSVTSRTNDMEHHSPAPGAPDPSPGIICMIVVICGVIATIVTRLTMARYNGAGANEGRGAGRTIRVAIHKRQLDIILNYPGPGLHIKLLLRIV